MTRFSLADPDLFLHRRRLHCWEAYWLLRSIRMVEEGNALGAEAFWDRRGAKMSYSSEFWLRPMKDAEILY